MSKRENMTDCRPDTRRAPIQARSPRPILRTSLPMSADVGGCATLASLPSTLALSWLRPTLIDPSGISFRHRTHHEDDREQEPQFADHRPVGSRQPCLHESENRPGWGCPEQDIAPTYHNRDQGLHNESGAH